MMIALTAVRPLMSVRLWLRIDRKRYNLKNLDAVLILLDNSG